MGKTKNNLKKRVVHLDLPVKMWKKFEHWRIDHGYNTLAGGVKGAIRQTIKGA